MADLQRLYDDHAAAVLRYCRRRADAQVADDVTSEVFLIAWRRLDDVPADAGTWLIGIARRVLANHWRGERRRAALHERLTVEATTWEGADVPDDPRLELAALRAALGALPERDREALMLVHWDGLTTAQAAAVLGCTRVAFRARVSRARRRLAAQLGGARAQTTMIETGGAL